MHYKSLSLYPSITFKLLKMKIPTRIVPVLVITGTKLQILTGPEFGTPLKHKWLLNVAL